LVNSFKKIAADRSSEDARTFAVGSYTEELLTSMRPVLKNFRQRVMLNCASDFEIRSYPGSYSQVINNLIMNALVHAYGRDDAGTVSISIKRERDAAIIAIADDGCGMDEETMKKIFLPFYTTRRAEGMSGLGLNAVYNTVTGRLGGSIRCRSVPGEGTEFTLEIPLSI
jgi:signal transduction histidine kinase